MPCLNHMIICLYKDEKLCTFINNEKYLKKFLKLYLESTIYIKEILRVLSKYMQKK